MKDITSYVEYEEAFVCMRSGDPLKVSRNIPNMLASSTYYPKTSRPVANM